MVEVVFSESAAGSLKLAQTFGRGAYRGGSVIGVFGDEQTSAAARQRAEERARREWQQAVPLGGSAGDVYAVEAGLDMGPVAQAFGPARARALQEILDAARFAGDEPDRAAQLLDRAQQALDAIIRRFAAGEALRVWYSEAPGELCGLYFLAERLFCAAPAPSHGVVQLVCLPRWQARADGTAVSRRGCGELAPGDWHALLPFARPAPDALCMAMGRRWRTLQAESAPLRACLNGRLCSAPETLYDDAIRRALAELPEEFSECEGIGRALAGLPGTADAWLARRIDAMVAAGEYAVVREAPGDGPRYARILRKCHL